ncbi:MAG: DUF6350 family protein [Rhodoglobus sp.]
MNRPITALFAAAEAFLVVVIGIAIPLIPLTILWGVQYGFAADWVVFWRATVDIWLLGHGVDMTMVLDPVTVTGLGLPAAGAPITLTIAAMGFSLLTLVLAVRTGARVAESRFRLLGELVAVVMFAALAFGLTISTEHPLAGPSLWQGTVLPTAVFAAGVAIGSRRERRRGADAAPGGPHWFESWRPTTRAVVMGALRGGVAAAAAVATVAALAVALLLLTSYAKIVTLYESLHTEVLGGVLLTLGQLAFLPNAVVWAASWLVGPGFAIGTGSAVSPLATQLGPIPAIPLLGALPTGTHLFGYVGLLVPVLAGFLAGAVLRGSVSAGGGRSVLLTGLGIGAVGGVALGLLAWFSAGSAGPGRLVTVGPDPWSVGAWAAIEIGVGALIGLFSSVRNPFARRRSAPNGRL